MNTLEQRQFDMLRRVNEFATLHAADFPADSIANESLTTLRDALANLKQFNSDQISHRTTKRRTTNIKASLREALVEDLRNIARCATAMSRRIQNLDDKFRLPKNLNNHDLIALAVTFAADVEPYKAEFIRYALPADFLEDLRADIAAFETATRDQTVTGMSATAAGDAIDDAIEAGMNAVHDLDALVRVAYRNDPATLAAWTRAAHIERPTRVTTKLDAAAVSA